MERREKKERELVPARRRKSVTKKEPLKEIPDSPAVKVPDMPRRWYLF